MSAVPFYVFLRDVRLNRAAPAHLRRRHEMQNEASFNEASE
jgi:hypothetical protein